jgi:hypothetical protein
MAACLGDCAKNAVKPQPPRCCEGRAHRFHDLRVSVTDDYESTDQYWIAITPGGELRGDNRSDFAELGEISVMQLVNDLFEKSPNQTVVSRYMALNGLAYLGAGAFLLLLPSTTLAFLGDRSFVGQEEGLIRVIGLTVIIIGVLYLLAGRANMKQIIAVSILGRPVLVPAALVTLAMAGVFPHLLLTVVALDMLLSIGGWVLLARKA